MRNGRLLIVIIVCAVLVAGASVWWAVSTANERERERERQKQESFEESQREGREIERWLELRHLDRGLTDLEAEEYRQLNEKRAKRRIDELGKDKSLRKP